jgi:DNA-binding MarR family transcriptional regulator
MQVSSPNDSLHLDVGARNATLELDGQHVATFAVQREAVLTAARARELAVDRDQRLLIVVDRSSPDARRLLREQRISYAAANGELFLHAPPVHVERPGRRAVVSTAVPTAPFAIRSSRVPRWLLLNRDARPTIRELSTAVELSEAMVSRTVRALADDGLVGVEPDPADARLRRVRPRNTSALLDAFEQAIANRRPRRSTWDIGARSPEQALDLLRHAADRLELPYAVGGLAGAALIRRTVEPTDVAIWVPRDAMDRWAGELMATPARAGHGTLTAHAASDPFVLTLTSSLDGLQVADPVQLYLDCRRLGERALDAADAIRDEMSW